MDQETLTALLGGLLRHALTSAAGVLVAHGYLQSSATEQFVAAGLLLAGIGWSWWQKQGQAAVKAQLDKLTQPQEPSIIKARPTPTKLTVAILLTAGLLGTTLLGSQAQAQRARGGLPDLSQLARQNDVNAPGGRPIGGAPLLPDISPEQVWQNIVTASAADLQYAAAMATAANTNGSKIRLQCVNALIDVNRQASGANLPKNADGTAMQMPDPALVSHIEIMAEIVDNLSPQGPLFTSCAGAAQLFKMNVLQFINGLVTGAIGAASIAPIPVVP